MAQQTFKTMRSAGRKVCPICGHSDWCTVGTWENGDTYFYCKRHAEVNLPDMKGTFMSPYTGEEFVYYGTTSNSAKFMLKSQVDAHREAFAKNGTFTPIHKQGTNYTKEQVEERDFFYRKFLELLTLEDYHVAKLSKEWGNYTPVWTKKYMIKSCPPVDKARFNNKLDLKNPLRKAIREQLTKFYPENGIAGFWMDEQYGLNFYNKPGILYPVFNSDKKIVCLRIGVDYPDVKVEDGYYTWNPFSGEWFYRPDEGEEEVVYSVKQQIQKVKLDSKGLPRVEGGKVDGKYKYFYTKNKDNPDGSYGSEVGLYLPTEAPQGYSICFATEGEKKCIVGSNIMKSPFILIPGVGSFKKAFDNEDGSDNSIIDFIKSKGCKIVVVAYDADKSHNKNVADFEVNFCKALTAAGIQPYIPEWEESRGKGIDDLLMSGQRPIAFRPAFPEYC